MKLDLNLDLTLDLGVDFDHACRLGLEFGKRQEQIRQIIEQTIIFLNGNLLIAQCLSSAAYRSKSIREYVLSKMLAPLEEGE